MGVGAIMNLLRLALLVPLLLPGHTVAPGFEHFFSMEYEQAIAVFQKDIAARPKDPAGYNHLAQALL